MFGEKAWYKIMFRVIEQLFIGLLSFSESLASILNTSEHT